MRLTLAVLLVAAISGCSGTNAAPLAPAQSAVVPNACVEALGNADEIKSDMQAFLTMAARHNDTMTSYFAGQASAGDVASAYDSYASSVDKISPKIRADALAYATASRECRKLANR